MSGFIARVGIRRLAANTSLVSVPKIASRGGVASRRGFSSSSSSRSAFLESNYNMFFQSNAAYATWIALGSVVVTVTIDDGIDMLWATSNRGKLYDDVDWAKFKSIYLEDDDDDDDDDEDDDEDDEE